MNPNSAYYDGPSAGQMWRNHRKRFNRSIGSSDDTKFLWDEYAKYARASAAGSGLGLNSANTAEAGRRAQMILDQISSLGGDITQAEEFDYSSGTFDLASTQRAGQLLRRIGVERTGRRPAAGGARQNENIKALWEERNVQEAKNFEKTQVNPYLDRVEQSLAQLSDQMTITAQRAAAMRSKVIETTRAAEASRLARVAAVSGRDPNDPSIQSLALRTAEETDKFLTETLQKQEFDIQDFNTKGLSTKAEMNANFAAQKIAIHNAAIGGDMAALRDVTQGVSALMQAAEEAAWQRQMYQQMLSQMDDGGGSSWGGLAGTVLGGAVGSIIPGVGTMIGAQVGGALGGGVDAARGGTPSMSPEMLKFFAQIK